MFNDRYGLTEAVLSGRKTQTRRIVPRNFFTCTYDILDNNTLVFEDIYGDWHDIRKSAYALKVSEVVAVAQSYKNVGYDPEAPLMEANGIGGYVKAKFSPGWTNKMFARADLMPHHIRITNVRVERLQDISDEDCIKEGVEIMESYAIRADGTKKTLNYYRLAYRCKSGRVLTLSGSTPREAYAALIDRISGKGVWETNPYVFVYDFELVD